jgi:hypothetical protein
MTKARDLASGAPAPAGVSTTELGYVDGVTSAIQTQINTKTNIADEFSAGKNKIINGDFGIWQRGTSIVTATGASLGYGPDRWQLLRSAFATGATVSRQVTNDTTNLPAIQYCARVQRDSGNSGVGVLYFQQNFESVNSIPYAGKTVTLSFYARKGADYSTTSSGLTAQVVTGTGTDQNYHAAGYTGLATPINSTVTLTTTWQRFTISGTLATTATELNINFSNTPAGTASTNDYYEITGVQLEVGSVATPYAPNGATYQAELAACQRYYYRAGGDAPFQRYSLGICVGTGVSVQDIILPVTMRTIPSAIEYSTLALYDGVTTTAVTSATINTQSKNIVTVNASVASGLTQYRPAELIANNSTSSYLGFTAEL